MTSGEYVIYLTPENFRTCQKWLVSCGIVQTVRITETEEGFESRFMGTRIVFETSEKALDWANRTPGWLHKNEPNFEQLALTLEELEDEHLTEILVEEDGSGPRCARAGTASTGSRSRASPAAASTAT